MYIDGKGYDIEDGFRKKSDAVKCAERMREKGYLARIIKPTKKYPDWQVYVRRKRIR